MRNLRNVSTKEIRDKISFYEAAFDMVLKDKNASTITISKILSILLKYRKERGKL